MASTTFKDPPSKLKTGDLVSHRRHGFGHVVAIWDGNRIYDIVFKQGREYFRHSCHHSYLLKVRLPE